MLVIPHPVEGVVEAIRVWILGDGPISEGLVTLRIEHVDVIELDGLELKAFVDNCSLFPSDSGINYQDDKKYYFYNNTARTMLLDSGWF